MSQDDPFGHFIDDDKTILRPTPGGRRPKPATLKPPLPTAQPGPQALPDFEGAREQLGRSQDNPLTAHAVSLLSLVAQLRNTVQHPDICGLRVDVINEIKLFEKKALNAGVAADQVQAARYALCALLDETVLNTPWGCNSLWDTQSLLITFHKETCGDEKFFQILKNIIQHPGTHLHLLELLYFCLCLGFQGKYRIEELGMTRLEEVREHVYQSIQRQRGDIERDLSLSWRGVRDKRNVLVRLVPLWVIASVGAVLLMLVFLGFLSVISAESGSLLARLYVLKDSMETSPMAAAPNAPDTAALRATAPDAQKISAFDGLSVFLASEIRKREVAVERRNDKIVLKITEPKFFASGSDKIMARHAKLIGRIAQALSSIPGRVSVVGHTDNVPIFSARFPSNWDLSKARAQTVAEVLLGNNKITGRIVSEGRADTQPLVPNDTPEHKAMNRRVEIFF